MNSASAEKLVSNSFLLLLVRHLLLLAWHLLLLAWHLVFYYGYDSNMAMLASPSLAVRLHL